MSNFSQMKILLIYPYFLEPRVHTAEDVRAVPLGVYYIGALLKENQYNVQILNWHDINKTPHLITEVLAEQHADIIGFSILTANRWGGIEIARLAKKINPRVRIVFGGIGATFLWEYFLTHFHDIDYIVIGEGEITFLNLVRCIEADRPEAVEALNGVAFRRNGRPIRTPDAAVISRLDDLPLPARYFAYPHVALTRGCAGNCKFCGSPRFWGRKVRFHSAAYFVEQLECLTQKGLRFFYFSDDTFTCDKKRVIEICQNIIKKKLDITWNAISRVDQVSEEMLCWMRKAGCIQISYGVESGSAKIRALLQKNISLDEIRNAFALTLKYGIMARAYFIYGCPTENGQTIQETIDLIDALKPLSIVFYILDLFPGTKLYEDFKRRLNATDDIWLNRMEDIMYFETDPELTREMILGFGQKLRSHFYEKLPAYVAAVRLIDREDLSPWHAKFYARLAMTFSHGDYAAIDAIKNKDGIAEILYRRSLNYHPNAEAYLGLGILHQKRGAYRESIDILLEGISLFPADARLHICTGVSWMNLGAYDQALARFLEFPAERGAVQFAARCYEALGDPEKAAGLIEKFNARQNRPNSKLC